MEAPEHPQIARCLAAGYPNPEGQIAIHCVDCECVLSGEDTVYDWDGDHLCEECVKERIEENYDMQTIAEYLGIQWKSAYLMEGQ